VTGWMFDNVERLIAWLRKPATHSEALILDDAARALRDTLRPGDVLLVEGKGRISGGIKYLTQSTWSHSALYVRPIASATTNGEPHVLIEANIHEGVVSAPLSKYLHCQTRICRPVGLSETDCEQVCRYAFERIGLGYDLKNIIDLMCYLFPCRLWRCASTIKTCDGPIVSKLAPSKLHLRRSLNARARQRHSPLFR
jgi:hypothetical protein